MKNRCFIICILSVLSLSLWGQEVRQDSVPAKLSIHERWAQNTEKDKWQIGIRMGAVASDELYTSSRYSEYKHMPYARGTFGLWAEREIGNGFSIRPELAFTGRGVILKWDDIYYAMKLRYFDIRVNFIYTFLRDHKVQPYLYLTPNFNFISAGQIAYKDRITECVQNLGKDNMNPASFGLMFGVGLRFPVTVNDFDFFINTDMGYNFGWNGFTSTEKKGSKSSVNDYPSDVYGTRFHSNFELAVSAGIPLSSFKHHERAPKEKKESWIERMSREREERRQAEREKEEQQRALLEMLKQQQANKEQDYNRDLAAYNQNLAPQNRVGDGIKMYVVPNVALDVADDGSQEMNLKMEFAYETRLADEKNLKFNKNTDDYPAGMYLPTQSKACKATLSFVKEQLSSEEMQKYFTPDTKVTIKITGETDGSAIRNKIPYKGEFGDFHNELIYLNGAIDEMTVTKQGGITSNGQLAFLRTQGVKQYLETYIDQLKKTQNTYQIYAVEREEKGSQFRKISVEFTFHNAYRRELVQVGQAKADPKQGQSAAALAPVENKPKVSDVDTNIPQTGKRNDDTYVLIVANEHYKDIVGVVPFAENDGNTFKKYCVNTLGIPERQIRIAVDATRNELMDGIEWVENLANARKGQAKIIVYYAGHGIPMNDATYLLPVDGNPEKANQLVSLNELYSRLGDMPAQSVTCFLDACFSGTRRNGQPILQGGRGVTIRPQEKPIHGNLVIFSAADASQTAYPFAEQNHGMFTYYLLKALQESKGTITYQSLIGYLTEKVSVEASLQNRKQTPTLQYSEKIEDLWLKWQL